MADLPKRVVVLRAAGANPAGVKMMARWIRAMLPTVLLVIAPVDASAIEIPGDAISLDAQEIEPGPLSMANAIVRAVEGRGRKDSP